MAKHFITYIFQSTLACGYQIRLSDMLERFWEVRWRPCQHSAMMSSASYSNTIRSVHEPYSLAKSALNLIVKGDRAQE